MRTIVPAELVDDVPCRKRQWIILAIALSVIAAAATLQVHSGGRIAIRGLADYPLPHVCMSRSLLGLSCPGCGLTRSFVYLSHGQWHEAWRVHRLGWLLAGLVVIQIPYRGMVLAGRMRPVTSRVAPWMALGLVLLLVANWMLTMAASFL